MTTSFLSERVVGLSIDAPADVVYEPIADVTATGGGAWNVDRVNGSRVLLPVRSELDSGAGTAAGWSGGRGCVN